MTVRRLTRKEDPEADAIYNSPGHVFSACCVCVSVSVPIGDRNNSEQCSLHREKWGGGLMFVLT